MDDQPRADGERAAPVLASYAPPGSAGVPVVTVATHAGLPVQRCAIALELLASQGRAVATSPTTWAAT